MLRVIRRHTRSNFPGDESRSKISQRAKLIEKKCSIEYIGHTTHQRLSVTSEDLDGLLLQVSQWASQNAAYFNCLYNRIKSI